MLWQIDGTPHKILGSIHAVPEDKGLPPWVRSACDGVARFVFEGDWRDQTLGQIGIDVSGAHLRHPGALEVYSKASAILKEGGFFQPFDGCKPWKVPFILFHVHLGQFGFSRELGVESTLLKYAEEHSAEIGFLEPAGRPLELFDETAAAHYDGLSYLEWCVHEYETGEAKKVLERIYRDYSGRDLHSMSEFKAPRAARMPYVHEALFLRREEAWLERMRAYLKDESPTLIIVGCLHCVEPDSFITALRKDGIRLTETDV
jgi:uncharacterized protein YbaP (TraB family)